MSNRLLELRVSNFRGLRHAVFAPDGVSALIGPSSSGKSTLLEAMLLLRYAAHRTPGEAIQISVGPLAFRHLKPLGVTPLDDPSLAEVQLEIHLDHTAWGLAFQVDDDGFPTRVQEWIAHGDTTELKPPRELTSTTYLGDTKLWSHTLDGPLIQELRAELNAISLYRPWSFYQLRKRSFADPYLDGARLYHDGSNLIAVLQSWRDTRTHEWRFDWVMRHLLSIHTGSIERFELSTKNGAIGARFYPRGSTTPLPIQSASNGILSTLLSLTAVAGGSDRGVVLLDDPENSLHPMAIRTMVSAFEELHDEFDIRVVLATHSPIVLDAFRDDPEHVWLMEPAEDDSGPTFPTRLSDLIEPEWLASFRRGHDTPPSSGGGTEDEGETETETEDTER